jgi:hypothetical protein
VSVVLRNPLVQGQGVDFRVGMSYAKEIRSSHRLAFTHGSCRLATRGSNFAHTLAHEAHCEAFQRTGSSMLTVDTQTRLSLAAGGADDGGCGRV